MDLQTLAVVAAGLVGVVGIVLRVVAVAVVPANRRPSSALGWLLAIFFLPIIGTLLYLLIGNPKLPRARREKQRSVDDRIEEATAGLHFPTGDERDPLWLAAVARLNRRLGALPLVEGNSATLLTGYEESLAAMVAEIDTARHWVHVEFYIMSADATTAPFFDAVEAAVRRGVAVRVLFDHIGSLRQPGYRRTVQRLERAGVLWHPMLPVQPLRGLYQRPDLRNHRKLLVVDGRVAWTGSQNIIDSSYNKKANLRRGLHWQDAMVRLQGPVVLEIDALFLTDWYSETDELLTPSPPPEGLAAASGAGSLFCQVVPSGPGFDAENNLKLFTSLMYNAERRIGVTSPYVVPDESLLYALTTAAERGVDVRLYVCERGDQAIAANAQRSYYEPMLRAGVRIFLYPDPAVLHAKHLTIDEDVAVIGSSNMDIRSFVLNLEISLLVAGPSFTDEVRALEAHCEDVGRELRLEEWLARPRRQRFVNNLARLTSALQ